MTRSTVDHYDVLGVSRTAAPHEIKAAYLRLIREHPPESDSEQFQLISDAYRVLSNPVRRREYDAADRLPFEVSQELDRIGKLDDTAAAERALRGLVQRHPTLKQVRFSLGVRLDQLGKHAEAAREFQILFEQEPNDSNFAVWLGDAWASAGEKDRGIATLKQAIVLDKANASAYLCLARQLALTGHHTEATSVLDRGIQADGQADVQDLPLFVEKLLILAKESRWNELELVGKQVAALVPADDSEARAFVASRIAPLCALAQEADRPDILKVFLGVMIELQPDDARLKDAHRSASQEAGRSREQGRLFEDASVPNWIKMSVGLCFAELEADTRDKMQTVLVFESRTRHEAMRSEWERFRRAYPVHGAALNTQVLALLEKARQSGPVRASAGSGCAVLICALTGVVCLEAYLL